MEGRPLSNANRIATIKPAGRFKYCPRCATSLFLVTQAEVVLKTRRPSISLVQRHLRIGYNRAARLIEAMEKAGLVTPMNGAGGREVIAPGRAE